jgi:predicted ATPase/phospholipid N-methyltransferase
MKFNKIEIPKDLCLSRGIKSIKLQRLSNVIAFVGKNGSGKSRILDLIENNLINRLSLGQIYDSEVSFVPDSLSSAISSANQYKGYFIRQEDIRKLENEIKLDPTNQGLKEQLRILQRSHKGQHLAQQNNIGQVSNAFNSIVSNLSRSHLKRIRHEDIKQLQNSIKADSDQNVSFESLVESVKTNGHYNEISSLSSSALVYLQKLPHQLAHDKLDCVMNESNLEDKQSYKRFASLKNYVHNFLNKSLTWQQKVSNANLTELGSNVTFAGEWFLNNRPFNYMEFSDGEKTLFAYALLFFLLDQNPALTIKDAIIIIDEPELHLHPNSEIDLIEGIRKTIGEKGQLIFATHSINILSTLNYEEIFMVRNGEIFHPSQSIPGESLSELMGIEERISKLTDFLTSVSTWTYVNFMAQCFTDPEVIESSSPNDPQVLAFKEAVKNSSSATTNMFLDFGAGKGRLYEQIKSDYDFLSRISYYPLEPEIEYHEKLIELGAKKVYSKYQDLPEATFDFILLCNVLHEIPIEEWVSVLNQVIKALKDNGFLIIIEAKVLSKGEKIGKSGFLLLDVREIKQLFGMPDLPTTISIGQRGESIISAILPKSHLNEVTNENILNTLIALEANTLAEIEIIRSKEYADSELYGVGRKSAFLSQQLINAIFAKRLLERN